MELEDLIREEAMEMQEFFKEMVSAKGVKTW